MDEFEKINKEYFDKIARTEKGDYQKEAQSKISNYIQDKNRKIILDCLKNKENILDLGCGNGEFTNQLSKIATVTGIDISEEMIKIAKTSFPHINFLSASIYDLPLKNKSFDSTICLNTIHHIEDLEKAVKELCRVTKNQILIEIKNKNSLNYIRRNLLKNNKYLWKATTIKETKNTFKKHSFKLYKKHNIIPLLNPGYILDFRRI